MKINARRLNLHRDLKALSGVALLIASSLVGCNPLVSDPSHDSNYAPGVEKTSPFTTHWPMDALNASTTYNYGSSIDFTGGIAELTPASQTDNTSALFNNGTFTGGAQYDSTNSYLRLG